MKKIWIYEQVFVITVLAIINIIRKSYYTAEVLSAIAVVLSFGHAQIAARLNEKVKERKVPEVDGYIKKLWYYSMGREVFWVAYFFIKDSYSALAGAIIFLCYPFWRKLYCKFLVKS